MNRIQIYRNGQPEGIQYAAKTISEIVRMVKHYGYIGTKDNPIHISPDDKITGKIVGKI